MGVLHAFAQAILLVVISGYLLWLLWKVITWLDTHGKAMLGMLVILFCLFLSGVAYTIWVDGGVFWRIP